MSKTTDLEIRLGEENPINKFNRDWINNSANSEVEMWQTYCLLRLHGLSRDKIATQAHLLGRDPETIERNYQSHISLLRQNYEDRNSGRELLTNQAQLLGIPSETILASVQQLSNLGIDYNNGILLGTTSQLKRKKMAWLLREIFDYRNSNNKKETIREMYNFVRNNPKYLVKSIPALERAKSKMLEKLAA